MESDIILLSKNPKNSISTLNIIKLNSKYKSSINNAYIFDKNFGYFCLANNILKYLAELNEKHVSNKIIRKIR